MALSKRQRDEQTRLEAAYPDRFEDAGAWLALANQARPLVGATTMDIKEYRRGAGLPSNNLRGAVAAPKMWQLRQAYEALRLGAKRPSLQGIDAAVNWLNANARDVRGLRQINDLKGALQARYIVEQYLKSPDRRSTFSRLLGDLDIMDSRGRLL